MSAAMRRTSGNELCVRTFLLVPVAAVCLLLARAALLMWFYSSPLVVALSPPAETGAGAGRAGSSGLLDRVLALGPIEHARPRHPRRPMDEAAMFAVHVRRGDPKNDGSQAGEVERLAAQRLARDDGAEIEVGDGLNIVRAHFVYENDLTDPLEPEEVERWLGGAPGSDSSRLVEASRRRERDTVGEAFDEFSGIYGAAVKTRAIRWLHESPPTYDRAWVIEPDVVYTGQWAELFAFYDEKYPRADLVSVNSTHSTGGSSWAHAAECTLCSEGDGRWQTAFLPVFRISRRLASAVLETLRSNRTGHHEALLPTVCERLSWCEWTSISHGDIYRYRPFIALDEAEQSAKPGRLYHPVKSANVLRALAHVEEV